VDDRQTENFIGLATPACAMWCGSLIYFSYMGFTVPFLPVDSSWFLPVASIVLSLLLVSEIPMFSMKYKKSSESNPIRIAFIVFVLAVAVVCLIFKLNWSCIVLLAMTFYIVWNALRGLFARK
jgi:CDP-diacylglycerol--serine O-phosphatidyltransferase